MSKKSSDKDLLEKIHLILDDPSITTPKKTNDEHMDSLKRRLTTDRGLQFTSHTSQRKSDMDLTPRVLIRKKQESKDHIIDKKESDLDSISEQDKGDKEPIPAADLRLSDDELFEVEKPLAEIEDIPEFIEVTSYIKDEKEFEEEPLTITISSEAEEEEDSLPQWEVVEEHKISDEPLQLDRDDLSYSKKKKSFFKLRNKPEETTNRKRSSFEDQNTHVKQSFEKDSTIWEPLVEKKETPSKDDSDSDLSSESGPLEKTKKSFSTDAENKKISEKTGFQYGNYTLYQKTIIITDDDKRTIHFFAKEAPETGKPAMLPKDYEVKINRKTGVPYIRKKQK
ncbi:MAG: hypothetical protein QCI00_04445 [Candidatus Thermoplasmatota archaeon]|nr:hypothetical protein [Candidatus Thermoplasmatota archaeon]